MKNSKDITYKTLTTRETRTKLGGHLTSFKKNPDIVYVIERCGCDDYAGVLVSPEFLRDNGIDIPQKPISKKDYEAAKIVYNDAKSLMDAYDAAKPVFKIAKKSKPVIN